MDVTDRTDILMVIATQLMAMDTCKRDSKFFISLKSNISLLSINVLDKKANC